MAMKPSRREVISMVRDKLERHPSIDWTSAAQSVAMEIAWNEQELLEDLRDTFEGETK